MYVYILVILANLVGGFYMWKFVDKQVYGSVFLDKHKIMSRVPKKIGDLNEQKFNAIMKTNAEKKQRQQLEELQNPFK